MRSILLCTLAVAVSATVLRAQDTASVPTADGFQCPVGPNGTGEGYYIARGYRPNGHLGDDWNGVKGGDTDFGDPVYATAHGIVVFAKNYHVGWGNVVILRHAFYEGLSLKFVDSLYGHLNDFNVHEGQEVKRGQLIGHIGNNNGMYDAHLHFEMRKNINIGMFRGSFPRDDTNYYEPNKFLAAHLSCPHGDKTVSVPINTFPATPPPAYVANKVDTPVYSPGSAPASHLPPVGAGSIRLSHESVPEPRIPPAPAPTPLPKIAAAPTSVPKALPTPDPTPKSSTVASSSTKAAPKGAAATASSTKATATPSPTPKTSTTASTSTRPPASPSPSTKATASTSPKASPAPSSAAKGSSTASTKTAAPPGPSAKTTGATPGKTASVASPAAAKDPASAKAPPAEVAASKSEPKARPSILEADAFESATPAPTNGGPIRRSSTPFRVDRFQDLRGMGY